MNSYHRTAALAITAGATLAIFATSAGAWDELPCGATHETAHLCAPGERARDGSIPVPVPVTDTPPPSLPAAPPAAPVVVLPVVSPPTPPQPQKPPLTCARLPKGAGPIWRDKARCSSAVPTPPTCADLEARKAGRLWFSKFRCDMPPRLRNVGPFRSGFTG